MNGCFQLRKALDLRVLCVRSALRSLPELRSLLGGLLQSTSILFNAVERQCRGHGEMS